MEVKREQVEVQILVEEGMVVSRVTEGKMMMVEWMKMTMTGGRNEYIEHHMVHMKHVYCSIKFQLKKILLSI